LPETTFWHQKRRQRHRGQCCKDLPA
jgi:hypothetical protein